MRLNDDMTTPVLVQAGALDWTPSPAAGVDRRMLYREGAEVARATSIVRYARGSAFPAHRHDGGEEILVLSGTFQDEHGDYPAGSYFRNPPGTAHSPASVTGCEIFVRLWQFRRGDLAQIVRRPGEGAPARRPGAAEVRLLHDDGTERVTLERWEAGARLELVNPRGLEILVLSGSVTLAGTVLTAQGWGRFPPGMDLTAEVGQEAEVWIKDAAPQPADLLPMPKTGA